MKTIRLFTFGIIALTLTLAAASEAGSGRGRGHGKRGGVEMILRHVELTAEQRTQIETLRDEHKAEVKPLKNKLRAKKEQLRALWTADVIDDNAILALENETETLRTQLHLSRVELRLEVAALLSSEQRAQLAEAVQTRRDKWGKKGKGAASRKF